jgi:hypothetical protein
MKLLENTVYSTKGKDFFIVLHRILPQSNEAPPHWVSSSLWLIGGVHIGARALLDIQLTWFGWLYRLPIPVGEEMGILLAQMISTCRLGLKGSGGRGQHPVEFTHLLTFFRHLAFRKLRPPTFYTGSPQGALIEFYHPWSPNPIQQELFRKGLWPLLCSDLGSAPSWLSVQYFPSSGTQ